MYRVTSKILLLLLITSNIYGYLYIPEANQEICIKKADGEKFAVPMSCTQYYQCEAGLGYLIDCSIFGEYRFDQNIGQCNFAANVDCFDSSSSNQQSNVQPQQRQPDDGKVSIHAPEYDTKICMGYPDYFTLGIKGSCSLFYTCLDGIGYLDDCRFMGNYQYDINIGHCNLRNNVRCNESLDIVRSPYGY